MEQMGFYHLSFPSQNNSNYISDLRDDEAGAVSRLVYRVGQSGPVQPGLLRGLCHHRGE